MKKKPAEPKPGSELDKRVAQAYRDMGAWKVEQEALQQETTSFRAPGGDSASALPD